MKKKGFKKRNSSKSSQIVDEGEKRRKISENQSMKISQEEVCDVCGHIGFTNALMYCSACLHTAVHQYCVGISPGSIVDTYYWLCEYCCVSVDSQHHDSSLEESLSELASALELETEQCKNTNIIVEDELEPLCILPPLVHHRFAKHQCRIAEILLNTSSTFTSHQLCSEEKYDSAFSTHENMRMYDGSYSQIAEGILVNGSIFLDHLLNDREDPEVSVSSLMEFPKEIMSGLILLVSMSGKIVIQRGMGFCACSVPLIDYMTNNCNETNSEKLVFEPVDFCNGNVEDGDLLKNIKQKRATRVKIDLLQPLGSECKRARSRRYKRSSSLNKVVYAQAADILSIGKEGGSQPTNALEAHHVTGQANTLVNVDTLTIHGLQFKATNKKCDLYPKMVATFDNNVQCTAKVHNKLCDQG